MDKLKFALFSIVTLAIVGVIAYWAVITIQSGTEYVREQKIKQLEKENKELKKELAALEQEVEAGGEEPEPVQVATQPNPTTTTNPAPVTVYKNQTLINELDALAKSNVLLKLNSRGPSVGTVQRFLNVYNKTSTRVDNDYGPGTVNAVKAFQRAEGLSADGEAGAGTFRKMIDWLKTQG